MNWDFGLKCVIYYAKDGSKLVRHGSRVPLLHRLQVFLPDLTAKRFFSAKSPPEIYQGQPHDVRVHIDRHVEAWVKGEDLACEHPSCLVHDVHGR